MAIALPGTDRVPSGPRRDLLVRIHELYNLAGQPAARRISRAIFKTTDLESVSHETVSSTLRGAALPSWAKLKAIIVTLNGMSVHRSDISVQLAEFSALWIAASRTVELVPDTPSPSAVEPASERPSWVRDNVVPELLGGMVAPALACHAALPAVIDSGFLHLLRINFLAEPPHPLPYEAEAELLLSPLFTELAGDLYEMSPDMRGVLLKELVSRHGDERLHSIADLLDHYTATNESWRTNKELAYAQHMTALAVRDPAAARERLAEAERAARRTGDLQREWYVAMRRHLDEQAAAATQGDSPPEDLALAEALLFAEADSSPVQAIAAALADPRHGGLAPQFCRTPNSIARLLRLIENAQGPLLVFFSGEGAGENWLATRLPIVAESVERSRARRIVVIVENSRADRTALPLIRRSGCLYLALPDDAQDFPLAETIADLLTQGIGTEPLTVGRLYREISDRMSSAGLPSLRLRAAPIDRDQVDEVIVLPGRDAPPEVVHEEQRWLQALTDFEQADDVEGLARCYLRLGDLAHDRGDHLLSIDRYEAANRWFFAAHDSAAATEASVGAVTCELEARPPGPATESLLERLAEMIGPVDVDGEVFRRRLAPRLLAFAKVLSVTGTWYQFWEAGVDVPPGWAVVLRRAFVTVGDHRLRDHGAVIDLCDVATALATLDDRDGAWQVAQRVLDAVGLSDPADYRDVWRRIDRLAGYFEDSGRLQDALVLARWGVANTAAAVGPDNPDVVGAMLTVGRLLRWLDQPEESLRIASRALATAERLFGPDHVEVAIKASDLAEAFTFFDLADEALPHARRAQEIAERWSGPGSPDVAERLFLVIRVLQALGRTDEALSLAERAVSIAESAAGSDGELISRSLSHLSSTLRGLGRFQDALRVLQRNRKLIESLPDSDARMVGVLRDLTEVYLDVDRVTDARFSAGRALTALRSARGRGYRPSVYEAQMLGGVLRTLYDRTGDEWMRQRADELDAEPVRRRPA